MKYFYCLVFLIVLQSGHAQHVSKVDFDLIKTEITDSNSQFFYPKLLEKMDEKDTNLNYQEYHYLYYGRVFQKDYYPYGTGHAKKLFLDAYLENNYADAITKGEFALIENPVDLEVLLKMSICCLKERKYDLKRYYAKQYYSFLDVIYYSGDGQSLSSAYVVISVDHEYYIAGDLGLRVIQQHLIDDCDLLLFAKSGQPKVKGIKKIKQLYFNVRLPLMSLSKTFKDADLPEVDNE